MKQYHHYNLRKTFNESKDALKDLKTLEQLMKDSEAIKISINQFFDGTNYVEFIQEIEPLDMEVDNVIEIYSVNSDSTKLVKKIQDGLSSDYSLKTRIINYGK